MSQEKYKNRKKEQYGLYLPKDVMAAITLEAKNGNKSRNALITELMLAYLSEKNPEHGLELAMDARKVL